MMYLSGTRVVSCAEIDVPNYVLVVRLGRTNFSSGFSTDRAKFLRPQYPHWL